MNFFIKKILFPTIIFTLLFILVLYLTTEKPPESTKTNYVIKSYKNTVALFDNDNLVKTYPDIVLNTLPPNDVENFNKGVSVSTLQEADTYLENFE